MLTEKQQAVCRDARSWLNTPYVPRGRVKGVGVDCGGLIYEVFNPYYGPFAPYPMYTQDWTNHTEEEKYLDFIQPHVKRVAAPTPGGITLFHVGRVYGHAAIVLEDGNFIHAWGRLREGAVTIMKPRMMAAYVKQISHGFVPHHFVGIENG